MRAAVQPKRTAFFAAVAGLTGLAVGYASGGWTWQFFAVAVAEFFTKHTPAAVMNWSIQQLGSTAETLQVLAALALAFGLLAASATAGLLVGYRRPEYFPIGGGVAGLLAGALAATLTGGPLQAITVGAAIAVPVAVGEYGGTSLMRTRPIDPRRREIVGVLGGAIGVGIVSKIVGNDGTDSAFATDAEPLLNAESLRDTVAEAQETDLGVEGVQTPITHAGDTIGLPGDFFTVSKNAAPTIVDESRWSLLITGAVDRELVIDYDGLRLRPAEHRFVALRCIGDTLNGELLDTALWTGIPLSELLEEAGIEASHVEMHAADGYVASVPVETLENGFLVYGMNGEVLPRDHGFPARIHLPGTWGELNVKWIETLRATDDPVEGFYEKDGWDAHARVPSVAKIWTDPVNELDDGRLEVGGHAYAGDRGVATVEVSVDGGETWNEADLAEPVTAGDSPGGEDVTRQWRYRYAKSTEHEVVARVIDQEGNLQPQERTDAFPAGPSGWVSKSVTP